MVTAKMTMIGDPPSGTDSSSSSLDSQNQRSTKSSTKENLYRKFFKSNTGSKVLRQGRSPSSNGGRSVSETRKEQPTTTSSIFPILSGRQIYPETKKVERAQVVKVKWENSCYPFLTCLIDSIMFEFE